MIVKKSSSIYGATDACGKNFASGVPLTSKIRPVVVTYDKKLTPKSYVVCTPAHEIVTRALYIG